MSLFPSASRLTAVLRAAQYLGNLTPQQDLWAELAQVLGGFFGCDPVLIVEPGPDGRPELRHAFARKIPAEEIFRLTIAEVQTVLETGFLGTQVLPDPGCALAFVPLPRDRRTAAVAIVGQVGTEPFPKEDLEILLALVGMFGNVVARIETERELRSHQQNLEELVVQRTVELARTNERLVQESAVRREAEAALERAHAELEQIFDTAADGMRVVDRHGIVLRANTAHASRLGRPVAEIIGSACHAASASLDCDSPACPLTRITAGELRVESERSREYPLGPRQEIVISTPFHGRDGMLLGIVQVFHDITERKRAEVALRHNQEWLRVTLTSIGDAVIACDTEGRITFLNPIAAHLTGWSPEEAMGQPIAQVFQVVDEQGWGPSEDVVARVLHGSRATCPAIPIALASRDGRRIPIADNVAPILDDQGGLAGVVLVFHDVTQSRKAEQELRASEAALKEADRRKDEFLAVMSHELRNPLATIRNGTHLLDHAVPGSKPALQAQAAIRRQTEQLTRLVDDLLDLTRIAHNKIHLQRQPLDLVQLAQRAADDLRVAMEASEVNLVFLPPSRPVWVSADAARVTQILGNLVINSGKFTDRGGHVTLELQPLDLNFVAIQVTDNGMGMDADLIQRVFLPFEQADRSLHRSGGLGLGLALVKSLTELHGGQVSASSPGLGLGSRFVLTLPTIPVPETEGSLRPAANPQARPHSILVIEDNRDAALTLKMLLEVFGHQVDTAPSGRQGLERARTGQPEVVFCDIGLPDMDGYAVATALRLDPKFSASLLVAMTGYGQEEDIRRALEAGFDQHLTKPVALEALEHLLAF